MEAESPKRTLLARRMASSKSAASIKATTGPKILLLSDSHLSGNSVEDRRLDKESLIVGPSRQPISAAEQLRSLPGADLDIFQVGIELAFVHGGADFDARLQAVPHFQLFRFSHQLLDKGLIDGILHNRPAAGRTLLSGGKEGSIQDDIHRSIQVRIPENDGRIFPSHFNLTTDFSLRYLLIETIADLTGPRERHGLQRRMFQQRRTHRPACPGHVVHNPRRHANLMKRLDQPQTTQRSQ